MESHSLHAGRTWEGKLSSDDSRYKIVTILSPSICSEKQRAQKVFKASMPLDLPGARVKMAGFGMQLLDSIDPNPDNMVCAGIIHTQSHQVGCLLRLEPNKQANVSWNIEFQFITFSICWRNFPRLIFLFTDVPLDCSCQQRTGDARGVRPSRRSVLKTFHYIQLILL